MHEMSLVREMQRLVEAEAAAKQFGQVKRIQIELGSVACVSQASLLFAFDSVRTGLLHNTELDIHAVPARGVCPACGLNMVMMSRLMDCSGCGHLIVAEGGDEMRITALEVI